MEDTFESLEDEDLEEEAGEAVEAILFEVTKGETCSRLPPVLCRCVCSVRSVSTSSWLPVTPLHLLFCPPISITPCPFIPRLSFLLPGQLGKAPVVSMQPEGVSMLHPPHTSLLLHNI